MDTPLDSGLGDPAFPAWLKPFSMDLAGLFHHDPKHLTPIEYRCRKYEIDGEVSFVVDAWPALMEVVGGAEDGEQNGIGFELDLQRIRDLFDSEPDGFSWWACNNQRGGNHVTITGNHRGDKVTLNVYQNPPEGTDVGILTVKSKGEYKYKYKRTGPKNADLDD